MLIEHIDIIVLACASIAMFIWAYARRPSGDLPAGGSDGGIHKSNHTPPVDLPPSARRVGPQAPRVTEPEEMLV